MYNMISVGVFYKNDIYVLYFEIAKSNAVRCTVPSYNISRDFCYLSEHLLFAKRKNMK